MIDSLSVLVDMYLGPCQTSVPVGIYMLKVTTEPLEQGVKYVQS